MLLGGIVPFFSFLFLSFSCLSFLSFRSFPFLSFPTKNIFSSPYKYVSQSFTVRPISLKTAHPKQFFLRFPLTSTRTHWASMGMHQLKYVSASQAKRGGPFYPAGCRLCRNPTLHPLVEREPALRLWSRYFSPRPSFTITNIASFVPNINARRHNGWFFYV